MSDILEIQDLQFFYGEIQALKGISLTVGTDEVVALIGANGAGKTTTLLSISGLLSGSVKGRILFDGKDITRLPPHVIAGLGVAQVLEGRHIFPQLTVRENLAMGAYSRRGGPLRTDMDYVFELFPRLKERETQAGGTLSGGEQQMLAVGRALMQKPKIILMDEPSLGLAPLIVADIFKVIRQINESGIPILLVEQNSKAALGVARRAYALEIGEIVLEGKSEDLLDNEDVKRAYLGY